MSSNYIIIEDLAEKCGLSSLHPMSCEGYPMYTKLFKEKASIYIKDGKMLKNRMDGELWDEVHKFNDVVIEQNEIINIWCSKERVKDYQRVIEQLQFIYNGNIEDKIFIKSK